MSEKLDITGAAVRRINEQQERMILGDLYGTTSAQGPAPGLTFDKLIETFDYCKPEKVTIKGETHELYGWKVHKSEAVPEGVIILTEKMRPGSRELGKLAMLFVEEGKAVIFDPSKVKYGPPVGVPKIGGASLFPMTYGVAPYVSRARKVIEEKWPDLICGYDDFFEVFDVISAE